jgi:hypothetical protein
LKFVYYLTQVSLPDEWFCSSCERQRAIAPQAADVSSSSDDEPEKAPPGTKVRAAQKKKKTPEKNMKGSKSAVHKSPAKNDEEVVYPSFARP